MARLPRLIPLLLLGAASGVSAQPEGPRYLAAVQQELERVGAPASCEAEGRARAECTFTHRDPERGASWTVRIVVSDQSETVVIAVLELAEIAPTATDADSRLRRVAELNWSLNGTHLDWDPRSGAVRLSGTQHTDTNFDRRAFRVLLRLLLAQAPRLAPQLAGS